MNRIFSAFLILLTSALLWLVPITNLVYDFQTDIKTDSFYATTAVGVTSTNVTLNKAVYDNDTSTIEVISYLNTDAPVFSSYNSTTRLTNITGLTASTSRTLDVSYDTDALNASDAWQGILDKAGLIWMVLIIAFPVAGLAAVFTGRA